MRKPKPLASSVLHKNLITIVPGDKCSRQNSSDKRRVYLTNLSLNALDEVHKYSTNKKLYEHLEYEPFTTISETREYLERLIATGKENPKRRTAIAWLIRRTSDNKLLGTARLVNLDYNRQSVEWGWGIDPDEWGNGYIQETLEILKKYVFETLCLNRLWGATRMDNQRAKSVLKAAGMREEGVLRQHLRHKKDGEYHDCWQYSMLADEFYAIEKIDKTPAPLECTKEMIAGIVSRITNQTKVSVDDNMNTVARWDSLSHVEIILEVEEKTGFKFSPGDISKAISIEKIYKLITKQ